VRVFAPRLLLAVAHESHFVRAATSNISLGLTGIDAARLQELVYSNRMCVSLIVLVEVTETLVLRTSAQSIVDVSYRFTLVTWHDVVITDFVFRQL